MGPIQVIPPGLMGLLQLKQEGRLPSQLAETVAPVLELRDWYLTARRVDDLALFPAGQPQVGIATGGIGLKTLLSGGVAAAVPGNQIWYVEELTIQVNTALATDSLAFSPMVLGNGNRSHQVGPTVFDSAFAGARQRSLFAKADRGFWAFPGDVFAVGVTDVVSAGLTAFMTLRATPCPV